MFKSSNGSIAGNSRTFQLRSLLYDAMEQLMHLKNKKEKNVLDDRWVQLATHPGRSI